MYYGTARAKNKSITVSHGFKNRSVVIVKKSLLVYVLLTILQWLLNKYSCFDKVSETFCNHQSRRHLLARSKRSETQMETHEQCEISVQS